MRALGRRPSHARETSNASQVMVAFERPVNNDLVMTGFALCHTAVIGLLFLLANRSANVDFSVLLPLTSDTKWQLSAGNTERLKAPTFITTLEFADFGKFLREIVVRFFQYLIELQTRFPICRRYNENYIDFLLNISRQCLFTQITMISPILWAWYCIY